MGQNVIALVVAMTLLTEAHSVVLSAESAPWYASIKRFQDCTGYDAVLVKPDGSIELPEDLKGLTIPFPYTREMAFTVLLNTCEFTIAVGSHAGPPLQVELLNVLWRQTDRTLLLQNLYRRGSLAGQLYALAGLYDLDRKLYTQLAIELQNYEGSVVTQTGCATFTQPVRKVMVEIENGSLTATFRKVETYMKWLDKVDP